MSHQLWFRKRCVNQNQEHFEYEKNVIFEKKIKHNSIKHLLLASSIFFRMSEIWYCLTQSEEASNTFLSSEIFQVKWFINLDGDVARRHTGTIWKRYEHYCTV